MSAENPHQGADTLSLTLLGTGSSGGVPRIDGDWGACDPAEPKNRRRRCGALLERQKAGADRPTQVLIDTAPDLREQLLDIGLKTCDGVLFTHDHADQTHGIDDVRVLAYRMRQRLAAHMDASTRASLLPKFRYCFEGEGGYPAILDLQPDLVPGTPRTLDGPGGALTVLPLRQQHGRIMSLGFRIGSLAYCNDVNELPDETLDALGGLDTLVIDALRYTPHPSHAHVDSALAWIQHLKPRRAVLTNLHIDLDYETLKRELPAGVEPAYDGMVLSVALP
ncbi:MAG: MBL fold metallo-hydrolase [Pseudomonadota bacterium]